MKHPPSTESSEAILLKLKILSTSILTITIFLLFLDLLGLNLNDVIGFKISL